MIRVWYFSNILIHKNCFWCNNCQREWKQQHKQYYEQKQIINDKNNMFNIFDQIKPSLCNKIMDCCQDCVKCDFIYVPILKKYVSNDRIQPLERNQLYADILLKYKKPKCTTKNIFDNIKPNQFKNLIGWEMNQLKQLVKDIHQRIIDYGFPQNQPFTLFNDDKSYQSTIILNENNILKYIFLFLLRSNTTMGIRKEHVLYGLSYKTLSEGWKTGALIFKYFFNDFVLGIDNTKQENLKSSDLIHTQLILKYLQHEYPNTYDNYTVTDMKRFIFIIMDGVTYESQSCQHFGVRYNMWSEKDHFHGVRFLIICTIFGTVLDVIGPFFTDGQHSDNKIYEKIIIFNIQRFADKYDKKNIIIICDRAWLKTLLKKQGNLITPLSEGDQNSLNISRICTSFRWRIEVVIAHIQFKCPLLHRNIIYQHLPWIGIILKSVASLMKFFGQKWCESDKRIEELTYLHEKIEYLTLYFGNEQICNKNIKYLRKIYNLVGSLRQRTLFNDSWTQLTYDNMTLIKRQQMKYILTLTDRTIEKMSAGTHLKNVGSRYLTHSQERTEVYQHKQLPQLILVRNINKRFGRSTNNRVNQRDIIFYYNGTEQTTELDVYIKNVQQRTQNVLYIPPIPHNIDINENNESFKIITFCICKVGCRSVCLCSHQAAAIHAIYYMLNDMIIPDIDQYARTTFYTSLYNNDVSMYPSIDNFVEDDWLDS